MRLTRRQALKILVGGIGISVLPILSSCGIIERSIQGYKKNKKTIFRDKENMVMKAMVYQDVCTGCELCEQTCPEVFKMDGDIAIVIRDPVPEHAIDTCYQAAEECPIEAIFIDIRFKKKLV